MASRRKIRLVVFDLDGTLTNVLSIWKRMHEKLGTAMLGNVSKRLYQEGKITYDDWARLDASAWAGVPLGRVKAIAKGVRYVKGAKETFFELRKRRIKTCIVSAGLNVLADKAKRELGADMALSNRLEVKGGRLTGKVRVFVPLRSKARIIEGVARKLKVSMGETAVVGDLIYDVPRRAGLKIAFNPKDKEIISIADVILTRKDLRAILPYIIGKAPD